MQKAKVAVLVSGGGTNLQALIDYTKNNNANFEISLVISNKEDAYALKRAKNSNIETEIVLRNEFKNSIDDYKNQTIINTKEINSAIQIASDLTKKLTTNQNLKGQYGEDCLESVLRACYPEENINYIKQYRTLNSQNEEIKPDYLVKLPNNKSILIDCKLNLDKFLEYKNNPNLKNEFIKDLNTTINNLSNKKYETATDLSQPDFILMYIPLEPVITSIYTDEDFNNVIKNAGEKNIIIVGNSSILTTLRLTKMLWAQDTQEKNIEKIITIAQNIYEYVSIHSQNLANIKNILEENLSSFNKEYNKMTQDNKFFKLTEDLRILGIETTKKRVGKKLSEVKIHNDFLN